MTLKIVDPSSCIRNYTELVNLVRLEKRLLNRQDVHFPFQKIISAVIFLKESESEMVTTEVINKVGKEGSKCKTGKWQSKGKE